MGALEHGVAVGGALHEQGVHGGAPRGRVLYIGPAPPAKHGLALGRVCRDHEVLPKVHAHQADADVRAQR
ncbi:hypothetical protein DQK91_23470, partial [Oceanidesulfovibrio marinus]